MNSNFFQTTLSNDRVRMVALTADDFEAIFAIASDAMIWEQHPNKDRYQREVFETFFKGALESQGAYLVYDMKGGELAGCTRYYECKESPPSVFIGYTFFARKFWGTGLNHAVKHLMMQHAFQNVNHIYFHVGIHNKRSRIAMERLGADVVGEVEVAYYGEPNRINVEYVIHKDDYIMKHMKDQQKVHKLTPILHTSDITTTLDFYTNVLGFTCISHFPKFGYARVRMEAADIMFVHPNTHIPFDKPMFTGSLHINTSNVDHYWQLYKDKVNICFEIQTFEFGMREFAFYDNNRYVIQFGQEVKI